MSHTIPGWGTSPWGYTAFGVATSTGGPLIIYRDPSNGQIDVLEDAFVTVQFFDPTFNLDTGAVLLTVDGVQAYLGSVGFSAGFVGKINILAGILTVRLRPTAGFDFTKTVNMFAYARDTTNLIVTDSWSFRIRSNPNQYSGLQPLPIEIALQSPFTHFISLEPYRQLLLSAALKLQTSNITDAGNKAARVVYQTAFATELSTLLNPYNLRDAAALETIVGEKQNTRVVDQILAASSKNLKADIQAFHRLSGLDTAYLTAFMDYLDSSLYIYRVSLVANVLLFAKAYELAQG